jgi:integrase
MSLQQLPSGRWRAQVYDPLTGKNVSVGKALNGPSTFRTKREAKAAREQARSMLAEQHARPTTVGEWWHVWTTEPLWRRPKDSTNIHNAERTKAFADEYRDLPLGHVTDLVVHRWFTGGKRSSQAEALRTMFADATKPKAGRLLDVNPFSGLQIKKGTRAHLEPPSQDTVTALITNAQRLAGPYLAAWLQVAAFTGIRPGELDALRWSCIDFDGQRIRVREQWSAKAKKFTAPKNGTARWAPLTPQAREALISVRTDDRTQDGFCFLTNRGSHFRPSTRTYHWRLIREAAGYTGDLYLATRHFAGWYMVNVLLLDSEDVAIALGHTDGGRLVRERYGHRSHDLARQRVLNAFQQAGSVVPITTIDKRSATG